MSTRSWITHLFGLAPRSSRSHSTGGALPPGSSRRRLGLEALEGRLAPATLTVNSAADTANDSDPYLSLRESIALVNSPTLPTDLSQQIRAQISGTLHGGGTDNIVFDHSRVTTPIVLGGTQMELSQLGSTARITIDGGSGITVDGNNTSGVFLVDFDVQATLDNLTITHGNAGDFGVGGGISNAGTLTVSNSTLSGNSASSGGGIITYDGTLTVSNCTLSGNSASQGGGLFSNAPSTVSNCTFSGNSSDQGGAVYNQDTLTLSNCTLSGNSALSYSGGGIFSIDVTFSSLVLRNTIVAGNLAASSPDIDGSPDSSSSFNLVGSGDNTLSGISNGSNGNLVGTRTIPIDPRLGPLGDNGGPTLTRALQPDSPARGAGNVAFATATDQRGQPRTAGGQIDLGAYQTQTAVAGPQVVLSDPSGPVNPPVNHVRLTFNHPMDPTSVTTAQFTLTGPGGSVTVTGVTAVSGSNNQQFDVAFAAQSQPGNYALVVAATVRDSHGTAQGSPFTAGFSLHSPGSSLLSVNSLLDTADPTSPYLTLREALAIINSPTLPTNLSSQILARISGTFHGAGGDQIVFDSSLGGSTITLSGRQLELSQPSSRVTIDGGSAGITLDANGISRILQVDNNVNATLNHLTVQNGDAVPNATFARHGGAIDNLGILTLTNCTIRANSANGPVVGDIFPEGGGIYNDSGALTLTGCTVESNSALAAGGGMEIAGGTVTLNSCTIQSNFVTSQGGNGGGIQVEQEAALTVSDCTLTANTGANGGGAIFNDGTLTVSYSTFSFNVENADGAALANYGTAMVSNSTLSSNSASSGGALENRFAAHLTVVSCTFLGNSAEFNGGAINNDNGGFLQVSNSTFSSNAAVQGGAIATEGALSDVFDCTITGNAATEGGGLYAAPEMTICILRNSIVAGNGSDFGGSTADPASSYNLIGDPGTSGLVNGVNHNQVGVADPGFAPLGYYGGPTETFALLPSSPARQTGDPEFAGGPDQRGQPSAFPGPIDIGAYQAQTNPFLVTTLQDPGRQFGLLSLREAVNLANVLPGTNTISFADSLNFGTINLTAGQLELSGSGGVQTLDGASRFSIYGSTSRLFQVDTGTTAVISRFDLGGGHADIGGGVLNLGTLTVDSCTMYGDVANNGGALYNQGTMTVKGSTLYANLAFQGAGIYNVGQLTAYNSTLLTNQALTAGGALYNATGGSATLTSLTISRNLSDVGGGLDVFAGSVLLRNCIVAANTNANASAPSDIAGTVSATSSYNLIGTGGSGGLSNGVNHNLVGVADPGLTTPDFISPQTPVFGFTTNSPALGAGDPTLLSDPVLRLDQHGNVRGNPPNIGAV
jgi:hypothetical protein